VIYLDLDDLEMKFKVAGFGKANFMRMSEKK
jgi:hypothetical protein